MAKKRLVVGISGASGAIVGIELLATLKAHRDWETHLVITGGGEITISQEAEYDLEAVQALADVVHPIDNIGATIASGSFETEGMVVVPCSMKTVAGIAGGYSDNLLLRAADVTIKEQRKLVLVARESPLSTIHLRNMLLLAEQGVVILPPMLTYYNLPSVIEDLNYHIIGKILDQFGIPLKEFRRWEGLEQTRLSF
ncbi:MAG: UbiX family flavin prenyltransferase [Firmicutes bacterium]|nr:UbiX family flavin prenyltransferase [Bacillota bacterium]